MDSKFKNDADRDGIIRVLGYVRPKCPGCGTDMQLSIYEHADHFAQDDRIEYSAYWYCANAMICRGRWATGLCTSPNPVMAAEDAYKSAMDRV